MVPQATHVRGGSDHLTEPKIDDSETWQCGAYTLTTHQAPLFMGILNVTPDSFSDGGKFTDPAISIQHAHQLIADSADLIDVGGESTRPGALPVSLADELRRVEPVLEQLVAQTKTPISIDTYKPEVARRAVAIGASVINDVTGFRDPHMVEVAQSCNAGLVVMHMRGTPTDMMSFAEYDDVVSELLSFFEQRISQLVNAGIDPRRIVLDPGIGFAKRRHHSLTILRTINRLTTFGRPILLGASRKSVIGEVTGRREPDRLAGTIASTIAGWQRGVRIFRVHDVAPMRDALRVMQAIDQSN